MSRPLRRYGTTTQQWRRVRLAVLEAAEWRCQLALRGCTEVATTVHIDPRYRGDHRLVRGDGDAVAACRQCHGRVDGPRASRGARGVAEGCGELRSAHAS